ncbi:DUF4878 domain-containing protein [Sulfurimonas sp. HSL3-2]|uniref:DUF4878 domain-containing protein n=1 Tax=Hydrocurvibacter mobilis TaxID=3131936 RepID=UPI0031F93716
MNFTKITLLAASGLLFLGCSSAPKDTVTEMYDALSKGDLKKLNEYATEPTIMRFSMGAAMQCQTDTNEYSDTNEFMSACMKDFFSHMRIEDIQVVSETDTTATVIVIENIEGKNFKEHMQLVKVDGKWKVNIGQ